MNPHVESIVAQTKDDVKKELREAGDSILSQLLERIAEALSPSVYYEVKYTLPIANMTIPPKEIHKIELKEFAVDNSFPLFVDKSQCNVSLSINKEKVDDVKIVFYRLMNDGFFNITIYNTSPSDLVVINGEVEIIFHYKVRKGARVHKEL